MNNGEAMSTSVDRNGTSVVTGSVKADEGGKSSDNALDQYVATRSQPCKPLISRRAAQFLTQKSFVSARQLKRLVFRIANRDPSNGQKPDIDVTLARFQLNGIKFH